jgi:hypothetical protein
MSDDVIEEYTNDCRIVHEERMLPDLYHFERSGYRIKSFENPDKARLYADIYELVGGFDEGNSGKRGVPPTVARADEDIRMAYFTASVSATYAARAFEIDIERVLEKIQRLRERAEEQRSQQTGDE